MANYFVSTSGDDSNTGTQGSPFATVAQALTVVGPGDVIYVRSGTYTERVDLTVDGLYGSRIVFSGYPDETVIFENQDVTMPDNIGMITVNASFVTVRDITVKNSTSKAVYIKDSENVAIENVTIPSYAGYGIYVDNQTTARQDSKIENCDILGNGDAIWLYRAEGGYWVINNNTVSGTGKGIVVGSTAGGTDHIIVRNNLCNATSSTAIDMGGNLSNANYFVMEGNTVQNPQIAGQAVRFSPDLSINRSIQRNNSISQHYLEYYIYPPIVCKVYNNTVRNSTYFVRFVNNNAAVNHYRSSLTGFSFRNNLFSNNSTDPFDDGADGPVDYSSIDMDGNGFYFATSDVIDWGSTYASTIVGWTSWRFTESVETNGYYFTSEPAVTYPRENGGIYATTIVSGSGTTWVVGDATFFMDGYGLVTGDTLSIGKQSAIISDIDYDTNEIEFTESASFNTGDPVSYAHESLGPNVGV